MPKSCWILFERHCCSVGGSWKQQPLATACSRSEPIAPSPNPPRNANVSTRIDDVTLPRMVADFREMPLTFSFGFSLKRVVIWSTRTVCWLVSSLVMAANCWSSDEGTLAGGVSEFSLDRDDCCWARWWLPLFGEMLNPPASNFKLRDELQVSSPLLKRDN